MEEKVFGSLSFWSSKRVTNYPQAFQHVNNMKWLCHFQTTMIARVNFTLLLLTSPQLSGPAYTRPDADKPTSERKLTRLVKAVHLILL